MKHGDNRNGADPGRHTDVVDTFTCLKNEGSKVGHVVNNEQTED